jgi:hypothetical protein
MSAIEIRILVVGRGLPGTDTALVQLSKLGWGSHLVAALRDANLLLTTFQFDVVLALEHLPDGRGYDLSDIVRKHGATLLVSVALSETCLWLPVVERGVWTLGQRAFGPALLGWELETLLSRSATERATRPSKDEVPPRRKPEDASAAAASAAVSARPDLLFTSRRRPGESEGEHEKRRA